jgi:hypothetical protein
MKILRALLNLLMVVVLLGKQAMRVMIGQDTKLHSLNSWLLIHGYILYSFFLFLSIYFLSFFFFFLTKKAEILPSSADMH